MLVLRCYVARHRPDRLVVILIGLLVCLWVCPCVRHVFVVGLVRLLRSGLGGRVRLRRSRLNDLVSWSLLCSWSMSQLSNSLTITLQNFMIIRLKLSHKHFVNLTNFMNEFNYHGLVEYSAIDQDHQSILDALKEHRKTTKLSCYLRQVFEL